jgi:hypothetical protein
MFFSFWTPALTFLSLSLSLSLSPSLSLAAPVAQHLAPLRRAVDVGGLNPNGGYIVSIKPNTVDPGNRLQWLTRILSAQNLTLDEGATQSLKLQWSQDVFNGIAGTLSTDALNVLRQQPEVAWVEEGRSLSQLAAVLVCVMYSLVNTPCYNSKYRYSNAHHRSCSTDKCTLGSRSPLERANPARKQESQCPRVPIYIRRICWS